MRLNEALVDAARGSPRDLMRLGNELLLRLAAVWPNGKLTNEDLDAVITQVRFPTETRATLREKLERHFDNQELDTLGFDLGMNHEDLPNSHQGKARELVAYCEHHEYIAELIAACTQQRPRVAWARPWQ